MSQPYDEGSVPPWGSADHRPEASRPPVPGEPQGRRELICAVCGGADFAEEEGRLNTKWGMGGHILTMRICQGCGNVLFFYQSTGMAG